MASAFLKRMSSLLFSFSDLVYIFQWQYSFPGVFKEAIAKACPAILSKQSWHYMRLLTTGIIPEPLPLGTQGVRTLVRRTFCIAYLVGLPKLLSSLMFRSIVEGLFHVGSSGSFWWNVMIYRLFWSLLGPSACRVYSHLFLAYFFSELLRLQFPTIQSIDAIHNVTWGINKLAELVSIFSVF